MVQLLRDLANDDPDRESVSDPNVAWTRADVNTRVNQAIDILSDVGVAERGRVGILSTNCAEWATMVNATSLHNITPVPINCHLRVGEVHQILSLANVDALFLDHGLEELGRDAAIAAGVSEHAIITFGNDAWEQRLAASSSAEPASDRSVASSIFFTSGTTGVPKGTRMSRVPDGISLDDYLERMRVNWGATGMTADSRLLVTGPLYHSSPGTVFTGAVHAGGFAYVMRRFDAEESLRLIERHRVSLLCVVPTNFVRWRQLPQEVRDNIDVSSLTLVTHTAASCPVPVKQAMIEWLGPILIEGYGGSELGALTAIDSTTWLQHPGSVGQAIPGLEVRILDDDGQPVPTGEIGRIYGAGSGDVTYLDDPGKTAAAHVGKWFTLGDMGWLDEDGFLFIADRRDDLIVVGGVNIYPAEVEAALIEHPAVGDVAVIGVPDAEWGALVKAVVELRPGFEPSPNLEVEIIDFVRERIAAYKCPRSIDFVGALPRLDNGKLYRRLLRESYADAAAQ